MNMKCPRRKFQCKTKPQGILRIWLPLFIAAIAIIAVIHLLLLPLRSKESKREQHSFSVHYNYAKNAVILKANKVNPADEIEDLINKGQYKHALALASKIVKSYSTIENEQTTNDYNDTVQLTPAEEKILAEVKQRDTERSVEELAEIKWLKARILLSLQEPYKASATLTEIVHLNSSYSKEAKELIKTIKNKRPGSSSWQEYKLSRKNRVRK